MTVFYWGGGTKNAGLAGSWQTKDGFGVLTVASVAPGSADAIHVENSGVLQGALSAYYAYVDAGGNAAVSGVASQWTLGNWLVVGNLGAGSLTLSNNAAIHVTGAPFNNFDNIDIGYLQGSTGTVTVKSGAVLDGGLSCITVGLAGSGTLVVQGGTVLASSAGYTDIEAALGLGWDFANASAVHGNGVLTATGAGSLVNAHGHIIVGVYGSGVLTVANGATVEMTSTNLVDATGAYSAIFVGSIAGATGSVVVTGAGSLLDAGVGRLSVGAGGNGSLIVSKGGRVLSSAVAYGGTSGNSALRLGRDSGSVGSATIDGAGSTVTANGATLIGVNGTGALVLSNGGALSSGGTNDSGTGLIINSGTGSGTVQVIGGRLTVSDNAAINANGTLAISSGGVVNIGGALKLAGNAVVTMDATSVLKAAGGLSVGAASSVTGAGSLQASVADAGSVLASGGKLTLAGAISGAGTLSAAAGAVLDAAKGGSFAGAITGAGTVELDGATTLTVGASLTAATLIDTANLKLGTGVSLTNAAGHSILLNAAAGKVVAVTGVGADSITNAGSLAANGAGTVDVSVALINSGVVSAGSGALAFLGAVTNNGTIAALSSLSIKNSVAGSGTLEVGAAATLTLLHGAASGQQVDFLAGTGLLDLALPLNFNAMIEGFSGSDQIDLINVKETSFAFAGGVLAVKNGTTVQARLHFDGSYTAASFSFGSDGHGGTLIGLV